MSEQKKIIAPFGAGRIDKFLATKLSGVSRTRLQKYLADGLITVNGHIVPSRHELVSGDDIRITLPDFSNLPDAAADSVPVLFEDEHVIVVNKPAGLVVHPAGPHKTDTLIQRLWPRLSPAWAGKVKAGGATHARPGVVHRLDRGTSGVMVLAKTPAAAENLSKQFADRGVNKTYWALVRGCPKADGGVVRSQVGRSRNEPHRMSVDEGGGRWAEMNFEVLARFRGADPPNLESSLLEVKPLTGRTHQIRVQFAALGHPLAGDLVYGDPAASPENRPLLHAVSLEFAHPVTGKRRAWTAPLPPDFAESLKALGWKEKKATPKRAKSRTR